MQATLGLAVFKISRYFASLIDIIDITAQDDDNLYLEVDSNHKVMQHFI